MVAAQLRKTKEERPILATRLIGLAVVSGLFAGIALDVLTYLVARYGPSGGDGAAWSFRGNGALIVPFGAGPAVLAGGWTALVRHHRSPAGSLRWGIGAGLVGAGLALASAAAVVLPDSARVGASQTLLVVLLLWIVIAPVLTGVLPVGRRPGERKMLPHLLAGVLFPIALVAGLGAAAAALPPG
jgi:hypothetical protein